MVEEVVDEDVVVEPNPVVAPVNEQFGYSSLSLSSYLLGFFLGFMELHGIPAVFRSSKKTMPRQFLLEYGKTVPVRVFFFFFFNNLYVYFLFSFLLFCLFFLFYRW